MKLGYVIAWAFFSFAACKKEAPATDRVVYGASYRVNIATDKAFYKPGDKIEFSIDKDLAGSPKVRYKLLNNVIQEVSLTGNTWSWTAPAADFTGYMVEVYDVVDKEEKIYCTIGVDVSSDPARFPRNAFLSEYGAIGNEQIGKVMKQLNRYHMNWVQFQDWEYKHHKPLAGTPESPSEQWIDIASRTNYLTTVKGYIDAAHSYNMKTLSYNLCYGSLSDAASDGVSEEWYAYTDKNHTTKDKFELPKPPFKSDIMFMNPGNKGWQDYIIAANNNLYKVFDFDGYQIDQVGNRNKTLYDYNGNAFDLPTGFKSFINAMKTGAPHKSLVMNAVTQYGQEQIATSPVDFLYSEVWAPDEGYKDLARIIQANNSLSNNKKSTVLAAYMNYNVASNKGYFNTPGVLFTDAVIFAFGASHLELGEHMLGKEYFPNNNLEMKDDLKAAMISYYDFLVGYQNLLRDGGTFNNPVVASADGKIKLNNWPPQSGQVSVIGKSVGNKQVVHLINFATASSFDWRDTNGTQTAPQLISSAKVKVTTEKSVKKVWVASPDVNGGASTQLAFTQSGNETSFTLPSLKYWDMVVMEYE
ncbi:Cycloisomaltooligosaccharide glucanotransferase precursor [compost metagenome]